MRVFSNDIRMELGAVKCLILTMKKGKTVNNDEIALLHKSNEKTEIG